MAQPPSSPNPIPPERRAASRRFAGSYARVECRKGALGLGPDLTVACVDISEAGIGLILKEALDPGQEVELRFTAPGFTRPLKRMARVAWGAPAEGDTWRVGLQFDKRLSYVELQRLAKS